MLEYIELKDEKPTKLLTLTFDELYTDGELPIHAKGDGLGFHSHSVNNEYIVTLIP